MNLLFLRGQVPKDRDPKQIMFDKIEDNCDMWTQLAAALSVGGYGEVWYWGGKRKKRFRSDFVERWTPDFAKLKVKFHPDVIFARGGFSHYDSILKRYPNAFKIYYGAGKRFYPSKGFYSNFQLILNDTPKQQAETLKKFPNIKTELWCKPAAENIFQPYISGYPEYDVIMIGNEHPKGFKGHNFALPLIADKFKVLQVGISSKKMRKKFSQVKFTGWVPRSQMPMLYASAKIAICVCTERDSCPRIIPESLACDTPILCLDRVRFWHEKYITAQSGRLVSKNNFLNVLIEMVNYVKDFNARFYYDNNLSMDIAVNRIKKLIGNKCKV